MSGPDLPLTNAEFVQIYSKVPRLCVDLVIKNTTGVLLTLRSGFGWEGLWHLPGGTVRYQEHLADALHRVAKSELSIDVTIDKFLGYIEYPSEDEARGYGHAVSLAFLCHPQPGQIKLDHQASEARYFPAPPDNIIPEQGQFLNRYLG